MLIIGLGGAQTLEAAPPVPWMTSSIRRGIPDTTPATETPRTDADRAYSLAKDMDTGEQLVTLRDFAKHGFVITVLALLVLWGWAFFGYWRWIGFAS